MHFNHIAFWIVEKHLMPPFHRIATLIGIEYTLLVQMGHKSHA